MPAQLSMLHAYETAPFANETKLAAPTARFRKAMHKLEDAANVGGGDAAKLLGNFMRSSKVPAFAIA